MFYLIISVFLAIGFIVIISIVDAYIFDYEDKRYFKEIEEFYNKK